MLRVALSVRWLQFIPNPRCMIHANRNQYPVTSEPVSQWARIPFPFWTVDAENGGAIIKTEVDEIRPVETYPKGTIFREHDRSVYSDQIAQKRNHSGILDILEEFRKLMVWVARYAKHYSKRKN